MVTRGDYRTEMESPGEQKPCARGEWCAAGIRTRLDDGTTRREPAGTYQAFCLADTALIIRCIDSLPAAHQRLHGWIGTHVTREVSIRVPFGPSVPLRLDVDEVMRLIVDAFLTWHERVARVAGLYPPSGGTAGWRERSLGMDAGSLLLPSRDVLAAEEHRNVLLSLEPEWMLRPSSSPAARAVYASGTHTEHGEELFVLAGGDSAGNEFIRLDWMARAAMLETPAAPERLIGVPCRAEGCERRALRRALPPQHDGDPEYYSECWFCGDLLTPPEYAEWTALNEAYYRNTATPAQVASGRVLHGVTGDSGSGRA